MDRANNEEVEVARMSIQREHGLVNFRELEQLAIRGTVANLLLPRYEDVDEEDAVTLLSILVETERVDPPELFSGEFLETGVVSSCCICWKDTPRVFELLAKLDKLEVLILKGCTSFQLTETVSRLPNLKCLEVHYYIEYNGEDDDNDDRIIIGTPAITKEKDSNLEILYPGHRIVSEDDLAILLLDVLPLFPKLVTLTFGWNKIGSFQRIAQRIHNNEPRTTTSKLRELSLGMDAIPSASEQERQQSQTRVPKEVEAIKTLFFAFKELHHIDGAFGNMWHFYQNESEYWLDAGVD